MCASQYTPEFWLLIIQIEDLLEHRRFSLSECSQSFPMKIGVESEHPGLLLTLVLNLTWVQTSEVGPTVQLYTACDNSKTNPENRATPFHLKNDFSKLPTICTLIYKKLKFSIVIGCLCWVYNSRNPCDLMRGFPRGKLLGNKCSRFLKGHLLTGKRLCNQKSWGNVVSANIHMSWGVRVVKQRDRLWLPHIP